jgi:transcription initiation factor IIE alpha subunit
MINQYDYHCPKCDEKLNRNNEVVLSIKRDNNEEITLYLDPQPGTYHYRCEPNVSFNEKEIVEFHCPSCTANLKSDKYSRFVEIILKVTPKVSMNVFFSRVYGVHKTYVGIEDFEEEYGDKISKH